MRNPDRPNWCSALPLLGLAVLLLAGCRATPIAPPRAAPPVAGPCASRLHEIEGQLLLFVAVNNHLPTELAELQSLPGADPSLALACPTNGKPYVYNPDGLAVPGRAGRLIVFDSEPVHSQFRWAIVMEDAQPGAPLVLKVVAIPESQFAQATAPENPASQ